MPDIQGGLHDRIPASLAIYHPIFSRQPRLEDPSIKCLPFKRAPVEDQKLLFKDNFTTMEVVGLVFGIYPVVCVST